MVQIDAYKLLFVGEQIILGLVKDITNEDEWKKPLPGLNRSINWVFGHYAAVEDWFLHHLNGIPNERPISWQDAYWADNSQQNGQNLPIDRKQVLEVFQQTRSRLYSALKTDLFHLKRCVKPGFFPATVKTRGDAWLFISAHAYWHVGEVESLRISLGYPYESGGINH
ncbi:MAG: DinB family protein [Steroidobacteraceae bacterium]